MYVITKGKKVPQELEELETPNLVIASNDNAWMTEELFLKWISRVWRPYTHDMPRSLLIVDQFRVHKMSNILAELEECGTDVVFIPPGLTFFLQPYDVFINKPLKDQVRVLWQAHMMEQQGQEGKIVLSLLNLIAKFRKPSKKEVINWIFESLHELKIEDKAFFNVIFRHAEDVGNEESNEETVDLIQDGLEMDNELIYEHDYDFDGL